MIDVEEQQKISNKTINTVVSQSTETRIEINGVLYPIVVEYNLEKKDSKVTRDLRISVRNIRYDTLGLANENLSGKKGMEITVQIYPETGRISVVKASNEYCENNAIVDYYVENIKPYLMQVLPTHMARMLDPNAEFKN